MTGEKKNIMKEFRRIANLGKFSVRKKARGNGHTVQGRIAYNSPSEPLPFTETISPGAFRNSLRNIEGLGLYDHQTGNILGRQSNGTLRITDTRDALLWELDLPATTLGNDMAVLLADQTIKANSFGFSVADTPDSEEWTVDGNGNVRRKVNAANLFEVSLVASPAYTANISELIRSKSLPQDVRDALAKSNSIDSGDDNLDVVNDDDERGGALQDMRCLRCQTDVIGNAGDDADGIDADGIGDSDDNEVASLRSLRCACPDESLRQWVCSRCNGLVRSLDDDEDASDTEDGYNERARRRLASALLLRAASI